LIVSPAQISATMLWTLFRVDSHSDVQSAETWSRVKRGFLEKHVVRRVVISTKMAKDTYSGEMSKRNLGQFTMVFNALEHPSVMPG
jgi:hypothetical protein